MENPIALIEAHQRRVDEMNGEVELPPNATALDLLQIVYRSAALPLTTRLRAAMAAIAYETPKLAVTAVVQEQDLATVLDRRLERLKAIRNGNDAN